MNVQDIKIDAVRMDVNVLLEALKWIMPTVWDECGKKEPPARYKKAGFCAYADGTNWNPNTGGKGIYMWDGTTWVTL